MIHPDEARSIVLSHVRPLPAEQVRFEESAGRILAMDLVSDVDLPPFRASTMDGFAVVAADRSPDRTIIGDGFAGAEIDLQVATGVVTRIMTGAPVPDGADAVVPVENTSTTGNSVSIHRLPSQSGENIRPVGSDMRAGDVLVKAGSTIGPAEIGLFASLGNVEVCVGRRPRVAILSTGDELVAPTETPGPGQIRDSNRFSLAVAAKQAGAEVVLNRHVQDRAGDLRSAMTEAISAADVLVTSGGVSMGDRDLVKGLLGELAEIHFRRVFMKPGKPLNFATLGEKLLFGLPGNPVSCLVSFQLFVRPALQILQSSNAERLPEVRVRIEESIQPGDRIEYQRVTVSVAADGSLVARSTGPQLSARLMSFVGSNALLVVSPGVDQYPAGSYLNALLIDRPVPASQTG